MPITIHRCILGGLLTGVLLVGGIALAQTQSQEKTTLNNQVRAPKNVIAILHRGGCGNCHTVPGVPGADGDVGPDLSSLGKVAAKRRKGYSAEKYVRESVLNPDAFIVPGGYGAGVMPQQFARTLSKTDLDTLVSFLTTLGVKPAKDPGAVIRLKLKVTPPAETKIKPFAKLPGKGPSDAQIALGRYLFFDRRLSANNSLSCASCHQPDNNFTDGHKLSQGFPGTSLFRNTPTLWNVAFAKSIYWEGRLSGSDLATVVRDHLTESFFMAADGRLLIERMNQVPQYVELFDKAFGGEPSFGKILNALAAYVRSLNTGATPFDRFQAGDKTALSEDAKAGWKLFKGKADCVRCHAPPLFMDHEFHDLGLRSDPEMFKNPERHVTFRRFFRGLGVENYRNLWNDVGRFSLSQSNDDLGKFRTPGLRQVADTAPYGHDGRFTTLGKVIDFYNRGGGKEQRAGLKPLNLKANEKKQLFAFLQSLSAPVPEVKVPDLPDYVLHPARKRTLQWPKAKAKPLARPIRPLTPLPPPPAPPDNLTTKAKAELGRLLYFDVRLSADSAVSCNTCHPANTGYTARTPISMGGTGTSHWRNASTLYNVAWYQKLNWDGAKGSIESQNNGAWSGAVAGNVDADLAEERLFQIPEYRKRFKDVFGADSPTWEDALRAVAAFQRALVSKDVPFDAYLQGKEEAISESAVRGFRLFKGKAKCITCHDGALLSDGGYHNVGLPPSPGFANSPLRQITFRYEQKSKGVPRKVYEQAVDDLGLYYVTKRPEDVGRFRTPSLRELKHTAPYGHNGVLKTLADVVAFYNKGGGEHPNKSALLKPLKLTEDEQRDLVAFLESLSGDPQVITPPALPPYGVLKSPDGGK